MNIEIDVTLECNYRCLSCNRLCDIIHDNKKSIMDLNDIKYILEDLKYINIQQINILGGEPTLNPYIIDICKYINDYFLNKNTRILLTTNYSKPDIIHNIQQLCNKIIIRCDKEFVKNDGNSYDVVNKKSSKYDRHLNFLYGIKDDNSRKYSDCFVYNKCGVNIFKLNNEIKYYFCACGKMICILLQKPHLLKNSIHELTDKKELQEICKYCCEGRKNKIYIKNNSEISEKFKYGIEYYKKEFVL